MSAAGMPSTHVSNVSSRNIQSKVQNKLLLGGTDDQYISKPVRALKDNERRETSDSPDSPKDMKRKKGIVSPNSTQPAFNRFANSNKTGRPVTNSTPGMSNTLKRIGMGGGRSSIVGQS